MYARRAQALKAFVVLNRAVDALQSCAFAQAPLPEELSQTQFAILEALLHRQPLSQASVAQSVLKTKGCISMAVDQLQERGLVMRYRDPTDHRITLLTLTAAGQELIGGYFPQLARGFERASAGLDDRSLDTLIELAKKLGHHARNNTTQEGCS